MSRLRVQLEGSLPWNPVLVSESMEQLFPKRTEQEHIDVIRDNNIRSSRRWYKYWRVNNLEKQGYMSAPWGSFKKTQKQFFEEVYGKKKTEEEHIDIIKKKI